MIEIFWILQTNQYWYLHIFLLYLYRKYDNFHQFGHRDGHKTELIEQNNVTEGVMRMAYPGKTLVAMGIEVDDQDAYYLSEYRMGVVWPVDHSEDRLTGEEVYSGGDGFEGIADRKISLEDIAALEAA